VFADMVGVLFRGVMNFWKMQTCWRTYINVLISLPVLLSVSCVWIKMFLSPFLHDALYVLGNVIPKEFFLPLVTVGRGILKQHIKITNLL
jgi:K+ transporter